MPKEILHHRVSSMEMLLLEHEGRVATVTVNRPDKLNALNAETKAELHALMGRLESDPSVGCIILTGAGEKAFVAGTDIAELTSLDRISGEAFARAGQEIFDAIEDMRTPVIAAVNGYALGGGCELALACHFRLASETAKFGQPEVRLGIIPGYGGTQRLARLVGRGLATELIVTGTQIDAAEAKRIGLVNQVYAAAELLPRTRDLARLVADQPARAVALALAAIQASVAEAPPEGMRQEARLFGECCTTEDFREGTGAFLEKRKPRFTHR
jgi:enoyl-CoA hydratase